MIEYGIGNNRLSCQSKIGESEQKSIYTIYSLKTCSNFLEKKKTKTKNKSTKQIVLLNFLIHRSLSLSPALALVVLVYSFCYCFVFLLPSFVVLSSIVVSTEPVKPSASFLLALNEAYSYFCTFSCYKNNNK